MYKHKIFEQKDKIYFKLHYYIFIAILKVAYCILSENGKKGL